MGRSNSKIKDKRKIVQISSPDSPLDIILGRNETMKAHAIEGDNLLSYDGLKPAASYQPEELFRKTFGSENGLGYLELMFGSDNAAKLE